MKKEILLVLSTLIIYVGCNQQADFDNGQLINSIIGDISFVDKFGVQPDQTTDENLRVRTHLEYVERLLRQRDISDLPTDLKEKREKILDLLHDYWTAESFPKNYDYQDLRKPCFIDKDGNICAVGYLIEQTAGQEIAEKINSLFKYSEIYEMDLSLLAEWVENSGLTLDEIATIQPKYGPPQNYSYIEPKYAIASSVLGGINLATSTINLASMKNFDHSKVVPYLGLASGAATTALGLINFDYTNQSNWGGYSNEGRKTLSMINIGLGTTTMFISAYRLLRNDNLQPKMTSWNIYSFPTADNQASIGLTFTKRF